MLIIVVKLLLLLLLMLLILVIPIVPTATSTTTTRIGKSEECDYYSSSRMKIFLFDSLSVIIEILLTIVSPKEVVVLPHISATVSKIK